MTGPISISLPITLHALDTYANLSKCNTILQNMSAKEYLALHREKIAYVQLRP